MPFKKRTREVFAVEIHDLEERDDDFRCLGFDLADVLAALGPWAAETVWLVTDFEPTGFDHEATDADRQIAASVLDAFMRRPGEPVVVRLSGAGMETLARVTNQTIDGIFIAIPPDTGRGEQAALSDLSRFATSEAIAVIKAIDSTLFFVATKQPDDVVALRRRFSDVREADAEIELAMPY